MPKVNTVADVSAALNDSVLGKKHEEFVVVQIRDPEAIQRQYAVAHSSTGKELAIFVAVLIVVVMGFFAASRLL